MKARLDPPSRRVIRGPFTRPNAGPYHRFTGSLRAIGHFDPQADMTALATTIIQRIARHLRLTRSGSFVLGDHDGKVYVLANEAKTTAPLVQQHVDWFVGNYVTGAVRQLPTVQDVLDDLDARFAESQS